MTRLSTDEILRAAGRAIAGGADASPFLTMLDEPQKQALARDALAMLDDANKRRLAMALLQVNFKERDGVVYALQTNVHYLLGMLGHDHLEVLAIGPHHHLVATCHDGECMTCGRAACPDGHELHFHHDGCPAASCGGEPEVEYDPDRRRPGHTNCRNCTPE